MHIPNRLIVLAALTSLSLLCAACGGENETAGEAAPEAASPETAASPGGTAKSGCSAFTKDLLDRWGMEKQLVLNLSLAKGGNLKTMRETMSLPDPATFRSLAAAFDGLDTDSIEPMNMFDTPQTISGDLRKTADLLQAALAAGGDTADPAWTALSEFYDQKFFIRHNSSISYYLGEAGCI